MNNTMKDTNEEIWKVIPAEWIPETRHVLYASSHGRVRRVLKNGSFKYIGFVNKVDGYVFINFHGYKSCEYCVEEVDRIRPSPIKQNQVDDGDLVRSRSKTTCPKGKRFMIHYRVHRLVMLLFKPSVEGDGNLVDHISGDRSDNRVSNLRWASNGQNRVNACSRKNIRMIRRSFEVYFGKRVNGVYKRESKYFKKLTDAIIYRNRRDAELHGEFATIVTMKDFEYLTKS